LPLRNVRKVNSGVLIRGLLHSGTGIRGNNPYHTLHIRDTAEKWLAECAR